MRMLDFAARRVPNLPVVQGDLRNLPFRDESLAGAVGYYAIQHLARTDLPGALAEMHRVLQAEGLLVLAAHLGEGERYIEDFLGHPVDPVGGCLYQRDELLTTLEAAGFSVELAAERGPLAHEADTQRLYLIAAKV
jgi:ubiquinone/menaquinone biosynthesis C-methylase UbiE